MSRTALNLALAGSILFSGSMVATSADAAAAVTFVSVSGTDAGDCSVPTAPCATIQFALGQTVASGEVNIVAPGRYLAFVISRPVSIKGTPGAVVLRGTAGNAALINVPAPAPVANFVNDVVTISDLEFDGFGGAGTDGIRVDQAGQLTIKNCFIREFSNAAINLISTRNLRFLIEDTVVTNNAGEAIRVRSPGLTTRGSLNRVSAVNNGFAGMRAFAGANVNVVDSVFSGNQSDNILIGAASGSEVGGDVAVSRSSFLGGGTGIRVLAGSNLRIESSSLSGNTKGFELSAGVVVQSAGNNLVRGNTTDVQGPGTISTVNNLR